MLCNRTVWFKKEFSCIGKYLLRIQPRRVDSVEGVLLFFWRYFFFGTGGANTNAQGASL